MTAIHKQEAADMILSSRGLFLCAAILALVPAFISGCAGKDFAAIRPGIEARGAYIEGIPFYRQTESTCGPAALAGVFSFWGHPLPIEQITAGVYLPELRGTLPMDMESFAREQGFEPSSSHGTLEELKEHLRKGVPVICLLDLGFGLFRRPHYITAIGFDDVNTVIIAHDGLKANNLLQYSTFQNQWLRAGRWMLVIKPKDAETKHES
jgi:ABC-type bacteriocin/lantibiotic exporter with double-glycine peptidase domain